MCPSFLLISVTVNPNISKPPLHHPCSSLIPINLFTFYESLSFLIPQPMVNHFSHPNHFSRVRFFATLFTVARQASLSMGLSRQEYWSGLPFPSPGDIPNPGIEAESLISPALAGGFFITSAYSPNFPINNSGTLLSINPLNF